MYILCINMYYIYVIVCLRMWYVLELSCHHWAIRTSSITTLDLGWPCRRKCADAYMYDHVCISTFVYIYTYNNYYYIYIYIIYIIIYIYIYYIYNYLYIYIYVLYMHRLHHIKCIHVLGVLHDFTTAGCSTRWNGKVQAANLLSQPVGTSSVDHHPIKKKEWTSRNHPKSDFFLEGKSM